MSTATKLAVGIVNGNPAERILVIAPNYREFDYWCRENDINPHAGNVRCVISSQHLRGYRDAWYVYLGVPDGREGIALLDLFEHRKVVAGLKNAYVTPGSADADHA